MSDKYTGTSLLKNLNLLIMRKFTLILSMLVAMVTTSVAQIPINSPEEISSSKIYYFGNAYDMTDSWGAIYYSAKEGYNDKLWCSYVWSDSTGNRITSDPWSPQQQFAFIKGGDKLYLYSIGAQKFVEWKNDGAYLTDMPTYYVTVTLNTLDNPDAPYNIAFDGEKLIGLYPYDGYEYSGYLYCSGSNTANAIYAWQIYEVGDLENGEELSAALTEALASAAAEKNAAVDSLYNLITEIDTYLYEVEYNVDGGGEAFKLQVDDPAAPNYIWCNEPEASEGPISDLIDGNIHTFFHSCWNGPQEPQHWLQVNLDEPVQEFQFSYFTRTPADGSGIANDFPDVIEVLGSNDGEAFTTIATINEGLPQMSNMAWESEKITADQPYSYLRFAITAERTYFHMAEFELKTPVVETAIEAYLPYVAHLRELKELYQNALEVYENSADLKAVEIYEVIDEIVYLRNMIEGLVSGNDDPLTVEFIETVQETFAKEGVGYPAEAPRAALKEVLDAAVAKPTTQARLDLEKAYTKYIETDDITLPVNDKKYTLTFVTWNRARLYLDYNEELAGLVMVKDTLSEQGLAYPETAVFTCIDNQDGTYSFAIAEGKYLDKPAYSGVANNSEGACVSEAQISCIIEKIHPNAKAPDATYDMLFGLVALNFNGVYYAPNSSGATYYTGSLAHYQSSWTSAMVIEEYNPEATGIENVTVEESAQGIYDLSGRRIERISAAGIYIVNGKKVLVK